MLEDVYRKINYPQDAREKRLQGRTIIQFFVELDGSISDIIPINGVCESITRECIKVVRTLDKFAPGTINGEPVRMEFILPIVFKLE